jgi:hypothetical protein
VTKVGKRISIIVRDQHTNRHPSNLKHVWERTRHNWRRRRQ